MRCRGSHAGGALVASDSCRAISIARSFPPTPTSTAPRALAPELGPLHHGTLKLGSPYVRGTHARRVRADEAGAVGIDLAKVGVLEIAVAQVGVRQRGACHAGVLQIGAAEVDPVHARIVPDCGAQIGVTRVRRSPPRFPPAGLGEVGAHCAAPVHASPVKDAAASVGAAEVGDFQVGVAKNGVDQGGIGEIRPDTDGARCLRPLHLGALAARPSEVCAPDPGIFEMGGTGSDPPQVSAVQVGSVEVGCYRNVPVTAIGPPCSGSSRGSNALEEWADSEGSPLPGFDSRSLGWCFRSSTRCPVEYCVVVLCGLLRRCHRRARAGRRPGVRPMRLRVRAGSGVRASPESL